MMVRIGKSVVRSACVLLAAGLVTGIGCGSTNDADIEWITPGEVRQLAIENQKNPKRMLLVDPRSEQEFSAGHIPGAMNVPLNELPLKSGKISPYSEFDRIVVYGTNPDSVPARGVAKRFMANSYSDVYVLTGGLKEWVAQGGTVETGDKGGQ